MNNSHGGSCLSLDDFDFAEKDNTEAENKPEVEEHPTAADTSPDFLAAFFRSKSSDKNTSFEAVSHNSVAPKKFAKKSQKERKREEQKSQEVGRDIAVCSPKERWSGWGSKSPPESSPSFADILTDEKVAKSQGEPNGSGTKPKAGAGRNRKASWRQLSFDEESAPAVAGKSRQPPSNPWKQLPPMSTNKDLTACNESDRYVVDSLISLDLFDLSLTSYTFFSKSNDKSCRDMRPRGESSAAFSAIVQSQRERRLERQEMSSKSLQALQIEERAMAELLKAASGNPCERVKVVRVERPMDPPIWNLSKR